MNVLTFLAPLFLLITALHGSAKEEPSAVLKGKAVYQQVCFACHGVNLEGAAGPSLIDGTWLHGSSSNDIFRVISKGVMEKGMMAYEHIYDEATRRNLVDYILSEQEGLRDLRYEIYPPVDDPKKGLPAFGSGTPLKAGKLEDGLLDLAPAEMKAYAIVFRGTFLVPREKVIQFLGHCRQGVGTLTVGKPLVDKPVDWLRKRPKLAAGAHPFEFAYQPTSERSRPFHLEFTSLGKYKLPLSRDAAKQRPYDSYAVVAGERPLVVRTSLPGIPAESMAVGLPGGTSFTLGRDGSVYTVWDGLFLDLGPNITNRGKDPSMTGSPWFADTGGIHLERHGERLPLRLREYGYEGNELRFLFKARGGRVTVSAEPGDKRLTLRFATEGLDDLALRLPAGVSLESDKSLSASLAKPIDNPAAFSVTLHKPSTGASK